MIYNIDEEMKFKHEVIQRAIHTYFCYQSLQFDGTIIIISATHVTLNESDASELIT